MTRIHKRVGGVAAVAQLERSGRVVSIDIHRQIADGEPCVYLDGHPCSLWTSSVSESVEGERLSRAELQVVLRRALRRALLSRARRSREL